MADNYNSLLASIGFPAADAAYQVGQIQRKTETGAADIKAAGVEERQAIDYGLEGRGVYGSGERITRQAKQQGQEARRLSNLELAAADDLYGIQRDMNQQQAEQQARENQMAAQRSMIDELIGAKRGIIGNETGVKIGYINEESNAQHSADSGGGIDWQAIVEAIIGGGGGGSTSAGKEANAGPIKFRLPI